MLRCLQKFAPLKRRSNLKAATRGSPPSEVRAKMNLMEMNARFDIDVGE